MRVLFILKHRDNPGGGYSDWGDGYGQHLSSGLFNSARFVSEMLVDQGIESKLVHVIDNNFIDREVHQYKPTHVIIEAYWVVPEKFEILQKLHPKVKWIIRNHSKLPFLANEGMAMDWTIRYLLHDNVHVCSNSPETNDEMRFLVGQVYGWDRKEIARRVFLLPNYYPLKKIDPVELDMSKTALDICCFGAVRPLKNQLAQAVAAMKFADSMGKTLRFHINATRIEMNGSPILKNLRQLFALMPQHELVEHGWMPHSEFIKLIRTMDMGLQVSYSETFNIVLADCISQGVPVVGSPEIPWMSICSQADPNSIDDIVWKMQWAYWANRFVPWLRGNEWNLRAYNRDSELIWVTALSELIEDCILPLDGWVSRSHITRLEM